MQHAKYIFLVQMQKCPPVLVFCSEKRKLERAKNILRVQMQEDAVQCTVQCTLLAICSEKPKLQSVKCVNCKGGCRCDIQIVQCNVQCSIYNYTIVQIYTMYSV